jgi:hypothetical protein
MVATQDETGFEALQQQVVAKLGRDLTAREKFHLAFSEACFASRMKQMAPAQLETMARNEQEEIKRLIQRTVRIFRQSQSRQ